MKSIEYSEILKDSPQFRQYLVKEESDIDNLEQRLEKIVKCCVLVIDSGKEYVKNQSAFATSLWDLQRHFSSDKSAHNALGKIIDCFQEMNKFHTTLLDQASRTVLKNLSLFVKDDINHVKDYKNHFSKVSESLDSALLKNSQANKNRPHEVLEAVNLLSATKSCFHHTSIDYVNYITLLQSRKIPTILSTLLDYYQACNTYYHQGSDLCNDFDEISKDLYDKISKMRTDYTQLDKSMQNRHSNVNNFIENNVEDKQPPNSIEGYLFKRKSKGFKTWCRRWFYLHNNQLVYRKRSNDDNFTAMEEDLRICTVRPVNDSDRRFCFEVISPTKSHLLQADSADILESWIRTLQKCIGHAIQHEQPKLLSSSPTSNALHTKKKIHWEEFLKIPGNNLCCDCKSIEPKWASINLGITLCIECCGIHRSLGVHYSKVRSLCLDAWEPENIKVMMELGNDVINKIYEGNVDVIQGIQRATNNCDISIRENYIKVKYIDKKFVCKIPEFLSNNEQQDDTKEQIKKWGVKKYRRRTRRDSCSKSDDSISIPTMSLNLSKDELILLGENINSASLENKATLNSDQDSTEGEEENEILEGTFVTLNPNLLLYKASAVHNLPVMCWAFALGANKLWKNESDNNRNYLHQAVLSGSVMACEFLLLNGVPIDYEDDLGYTALHLATINGSIAQTYLLLKHKARHDILSKDNKMPIDIAVDKRNADIVTLLRLTRLNEEIGLTDEATGEDETYKDVMKDFSNFASNQPRLLRNRNDDNSDTDNKDSLN